MSTSAIEVKKFVAEITGVKALTDADDPGTFEGIISVFGNKDSYGDVMMPGSFAKTLANWSTLEREIPVLWMHDTFEPAVGVVFEAKEVEAIDGAPAGLYVKARLFIDDSARAREIYAGMLAKVQVEFSFGYQEVQAADVNDPDDGSFMYRAVYEVILREISPVFRGANPDTVLIGAKSDEEQEPEEEQEETPATVDVGLMFRTLQLAKMRSRTDR